jgi:hypothetical protein
MMRYRISHFALSWAPIRVFCGNFLMEARDEDF